MSQSQSVVHASFDIERNYDASPARVFAAFADPLKKRRWFAGDEGGSVISHDADFREGGHETTRFGFAAGTEMRNDTVYLDIIDGRRIVLAYSMVIGERRISSSLATFEMIPAAGGTRLVFTEQAAFFEGSDGPEMRERGWRELLDKLEASLRNA